MKTTIDASGRLVIPKDIRRQAGLRTRTLPEVRRHDGRIEIECASAHVDLIRKGRFVVAVPLGAGPILTSREVEATRGTIMREHEPRR